MAMEIAGQNIARPWVRLWARLLDISLYSVILMLFFPKFADMQIVWPIDYAHAFLQSLASQWAAWSLMLLVFSIISETILLSAVGTTLGKWLLKVKLSSASGKKLSFFAALNRTFLVYFRGFALFIPVISIITLFYAYAALSSSGSTSWDKECRVTVSHGQIGFLRIIGCAVLFIIFLNLKFTLVNMTMGVDYMTFKQRVMYACGIRG